MRTPDGVFGGYVFDVEGTAHLGDELPTASATHGPGAHSETEGGD